MVVDEKAADKKEEVKNGTPTPEEEKKQESTNDGVKILKEVFGEKINVTTPTKDVETTSQTSTKSSASEKSKEEQKPAAPSKMMGPAPPGAQDFDEAEIAKAEEFKS